MVIHLIAKILVIIGALNWGLTGLANLTGISQINVIEHIGVTVLGQSNIVDYIYLLVGIAAIVVIVFTIMKKQQQ